MKKIVTFACAIMTTGILLTGCADLKEFAGDSIDSIGGKISETVDDVGQALGLNEPTQIPTAAPKPKKQYEVAPPKATRTPEEEEVYQKECEEIANKAKEAIANKGKATPVPTKTDDKKDGKKDKNKDKDKATPTPIPTESSTEPTAEPTAEPTKEPASTPTPKPTEAPEITPGGGVADW